MGDELGLLNDHAYRSDSRRAGDNRWTHRPRMPWPKAERRRDLSTIEGRVFDGLRHLAHVRATIPSLHAAVESVPLDIGTEGVLALARRHPAGAMVELYNVSDRWQRVRVDAAHQSVSSGLGIGCRRLRRCRIAGSTICHRMRLGG